MAKTEAQREKKKRWLRKHPEIVIRQLEKWISKEKDPEQLKRAKGILERHKK